MKKYLLFLLCLSSLIKVNGQYVVIPDTNFLNKIISFVPSAVFGNTIDTTDASLTSLQNMNVQNCNIVNLSGIEYFDGLLGLNCSSNAISIINKLPPRLISFTCALGSLSVINSFPSTITELLIGSNQLTNLPTLPPNLFLIDCTDNLLDSLPQLPNSLQVLACAYNPIQCLPILPDTLNELIAGNSNITCLPNLPSNLGSSDIGFTICDSINSSCTTLSNKISENVKPLDLELFPNPTTNEFTIKNISSNEKTMLTIITPFGQIVYTENIFGKDEFVVDVKLAKGIYFVRVEEVLRTLIVE